MLTLCLRTCPSSPFHLSARQGPACSLGLSSNAASFRKEPLISPHQHILILCPPPAWAAPLHSTLSLQQQGYSHCSFVRLRRPQRKRPWPWTSTCSAGAAGTRLRGLGWTCSLSEHPFSLLTQQGPQEDERLGSPVSASAQRSVSSSRLHLEPAVFPGLPSRRGCPSQSLSAFACFPLVTGCSHPTHW